jgi:hypothetical protein
VPWPSGKARVCKTLIPRFKSGRHLQQVGFFVTALGACHREAPPAPIAGETAVGIANRDASEREQGLLSRVYSYSAGPLMVGDGWTRRRYTRGRATIEVTVAKRPMTAPEYEDWCRQASDYPAARLAFSSASGFFTCAGDAAAAACDLHVQTAAGTHLELAGGDHATRADLEQLYASLNWK